MRNAKGIVLIILIMIIFIGCSSPELIGSKPQVEKLVGYIFIKDNVVYVDRVEIVTREDKDRIKELGLEEERDYPSGYHIHNPARENETYSLEEDTVYEFTDFDLKYTSDSNSTRIYKTTKIIEFINASSYNDVSLEEQTIPYFIYVLDGKVIRIVEEFVYTI